VIVEVDRGQDLGRVSAVGPVAAKKCAGSCSGCSLAEATAPPTDAPRRILRRATAEDTAVAEQLHLEEEDVRRRVIERAHSHRSHESLGRRVAVGQEELTVYFTAEQRVDFRALVRDLASLFHTRIELRQIGARDEASGSTAWAAAAASTAAPAGCRSCGR